MTAARLAAPDLHDRLARDGYAVVEDFIGPSEIDHLIDVFHALDCETHRGAWTNSLFSTDLDYRFKVHASVAEIFKAGVEALLPGYRFCLCNFLVKEPDLSEGGVVQIHQDPTFVDEDEHDSIGIWVPLVDTDVTNGAIVALPGSHHWNDNPRSFGRWSPYWQLSDAMLDAAVTMPMKAGSALIFSQKLFHGSRTNRSGETRVTASALLVPEGAPLLCYHA